MRKTCKKCDYRPTSGVCKIDCVREIRDAHMTIELDKNHVMRLAAKRGFKYQVDVYRRLGIYGSTWSDRFAKTGWSWESFVALCGVLECEMHEVLEGLAL